jgi:hypothetical protein
MRRMSVEYHPFVLSEVEGRYCARVATCFDFAQHERDWMVR